MMPSPRRGRRWPPIRSACIRINSLVVGCLARDVDRVISEADQLIGEYPAFSEPYRWKAMAMTALGDYSAARELCERTVQVSNGHQYGTFGVAATLAIEGHTAQARERLEEMLRGSDRDWMNPMGVAWVYQSLGTTMRR